MIPVLLLIFLSLCNAQWPFQNIGPANNGPVMESLDQPGYPYDDVAELVKNIPNPRVLRLPPAVASPEKPKILRLQSPDVDNRRIKALLEALEYPDSSSSTSSSLWSDDEELESIRRKPKPSLNTPKFPVPTIFSKIVESIILSERSSIRNGVVKLVHQTSAVRNNTDHLLRQFNLLYINLAIDESDNAVGIENAYKYGVSVVLRFLFEFYRIFRKVSSMAEQNQMRIGSVDVYAVSFDKAVDVLKEKREYTPLQLSAPLKRSFDIFKSILYESTNIIQMKCSVTDPNWKCIIVYLANLIKDTASCSNVWYHALIHMLALEKTKHIDNFVYKIVNLEKFRELTFFQNIFDFIVDLIQLSKEAGRVELSAEAVLFNILANLQENGLLNCIGIDDVYIV